MKGKEFQQTAEHAQITEDITKELVCGQQHKRKTAQNCKQEKEIRACNDVKRLEHRTDALLQCCLDRCCTKDRSNVRKKVSSQLLWKRIKQQPQMWQRAGVRPERTTERWSPECSERDGGAKEGLLEVWLQVIYRWAKDRGKNQLGDKKTQTYKTLRSYINSSSDFFMVGLIIWIHKKGR